jgi:subtilisin family serine protease
MGGTSMATPQVAGVAGLLLSLQPDLTPSQVRHYLQAGATDIGKPGYDEYFNFGLLNAYDSLLAAMKSNGKPTKLDG